MAKTRNQPTLLSDKTKDTLATANKVGWSIHIRLLNDFLLSEPAKKTKVLELNHRICFSQQPVKQCPTGMMAIYDKNSSQQQEEGESRDQQDDDERDDGKKVHFNCLDRFSDEASRLKRQLGQGIKVVQTTAGRGRTSSMVEKVREPKKCVRRPH